MVVILPILRVSLAFIKDHFLHSNFENVMGERVEMVLSGFHLTLKKKKIKDFFKGGMECHNCQRNNSSCIAFEDYV